MKKKTPINSAVRHLISSFDSNVIAATKFEKKVEIWNIQEAKKISQFDTILDYGGERIVISPIHSKCFAAAYDQYGLACYDILSGSVLWKRPDLKKIQKIELSHHEDRLFCCFDEEDIYVLDTITGETITLIQGMQRVWISHYDEIMVKTAEDIYLSKLEGNEIFTIEPKSFAVLDVAFSQKHLCLSESAGPTRIFDLKTGEKTLEYDLPEDHHILKLSSYNGESVFFGILWNYSEGGSKYLVRIMPNDKDLVFVRQLDDICAFAFCNKGVLLITSIGEQIDCHSGNTIKLLDFSQ